MDVDPPLAPHPPAPALYYFNNPTGTGYDDTGRPDLYPFDAAVSESFSPSFFSPFLLDEEAAAIRLLLTPAASRVHVHRPRIATTSQQASTATRATALEVGLYRALRLACDERPTDHYEASLGVGHLVSAGNNQEQLEHLYHQQHHEAERHYPLPPSYTPPMSTAFSCSPLVGQEVSKVFVLLLLPDPGLHPSPQLTHGHAPMLASSFPSGRPAGGGLVYGSTRG